MRIFAACVAAILVASVFADDSSTPALPKIYLPPNPTSAEYFDAAVSALTETMRYGIHTFVFIRNITIYTPYYDNRVVTRNFTETVQAFDHFKGILSNHTRNGMKKLREEIVRIDRSVEWNLTKEIYEYWTDLQSGDGQKSMVSFSDETSKVYSRFNYIMETRNYRGMELIPHNVYLATKAATRKYFTELYHFNKDYKTALLKWHKLLKAYHTSNSPAVMWFESYYNDEELALRMTNVRMAELSSLLNFKPDNY